ncbi:PAS domain-containing sensor histidine kinase [Ramlibacter sp. Leaf400]|uniref:PAS domain-containing sensor histidine kinase n=1 Tax=Ramlibacter sp. Leaf400 TaxID=1736365 RepID=UPI0009E6B537|nr:PAS domain S-box protein [Ramlibacter sp. Leaf400]
MPGFAWKADSSAAARLASLLDSAMDAIISVDEGQRIVLYNRAAEKIFGWPPEQALGQPLTLLLPERFQASHNAAVRRFGATGVTSRRMSGSAVVYGRRVSGEEFPVDASISQVDLPEGKLFTVILRDVTERAQAEREQARLASRLSGLVDSAMDAIVTVDASQRIVLYNRTAERIFGWPAVQVMGRPMEMLMPQRFRAAHRQHVKRFGETGITTRRMGAGALIVGLRANGQEFPMEASISQLETDEGKLYSVILRDVTERVQAQEELAAFAAEASGAREQEKARIARELHDELAQSLTALTMDLHWLRKNYRSGSADVPAKLDAMETILEGSTAATRRIAADLRPPVLDDLGLAPALQWLVQGFRQRAEVDCDLEMDEDLEVDEPYATAVFRIVQESLANVRKHAQARHVQVRVDRSAEAITLCVRDDGVGFATTGARRPESLGLLGLRERARLLGGSVAISSAQGEGTSVQVQLPARRAGVA